MGQAVAFFAIFCAFVLLPSVVLGWSVAAKWLDIQQQLLQLEREKIRLLGEDGVEKERLADPEPDAPAAPLSEERPPS